MTALNNPAGLKTQDYAFFAGVLANQSALPRKAKSHRRGSGGARVGDPANSEKMLQWVHTHGA
ncbi:MAG: hypothetical protein WBM24_02730 [Candidatus Sulfotelmatobacter sp.]